ncbi:Unknown protein [Striga hermonthica]|uniref:Peptidase A1 domain-containing protein n=1 Tax=Striga hermonthica TaxID=68872 RepID=A0A9N7NX74_STRHE|nr:Unknown protein [Striga hermonthica]
MADTASDLTWTPCHGRGNTCHYNIKFADGTAAVGELFADTITFDDISTSNIMFGCNYAHNNSLPMVGFGGRELSLVNQLGQGRFSYCLVPVADDKTTSKMSFGKPVTGEGVVGTTAAPTPETKSYYVVELEGMSFGKTMLDKFSGLQEMILDIGTTLTRLLGGVTVHMGGGKAVTLGYNNLLINTSSGNGQVVLCLMVTPTGAPALGSLAQADFLVGFDLKQRTVSFKETKCG